MALFFLSAHNRPSSRLSPWLAPLYPPPWTIPSALVHANSTAPQEAQPKHSDSSTSAPHLQNLSRPQQNMPLPKLSLYETDRWIDVHVQDLGLRITVGSKEGSAVIPIQQTGPSPLPRGFFLTICSAVTPKSRCVLRQATTWMALENIPLSEKVITTDHTIYDF